MPFRAHLLYWFALFCVTAALSQPLQFRHYTVNDGLCNSTVYYAKQDAKGYMWFCTESGVNRFDGKYFEAFTINDRLADNENFMCMEDSKGRIWFLSYNGQLSYFDGASFQNERSDHTLYSTEDTSQKYITGMLEDKHGNIWFSKYLNEDVYTYTGKTILKRSVLDIFGSIRNASSRFFLNYRDTANFIDNLHDSLFRLNLISRKATLVKGDMDRNEFVLRSYCQAVPGQSAFYFLSTKRLLHFRNDSIFNDVEASSLGLGPELNISTFLLHGSDLWLGTTKGLVLIRDFKTKGFTGNFERYLNDIAIAHLSNDKEGGLWVATMTEGVFFLPGSQAYVTNIPITAVTSIKHSGCGNRYAIGTYYGEFMLMSGDKILHKYNYKFNGPQRIKGLKWLSCDELIIGMDMGTYEYSIYTRKLRPFYQTYLYGDASTVIFSDVDEGPAGKWFACRTSIVLQQGKKKELIYGTPNYFAEKIISIAEGGTKGCWFTSVRRLQWLDLPTRKSTLIAGPEIFLSNLKDIRNVNGCVWVATDGNGIFVFKDNKPVAHLHAANTALTSNVCQKLLFDGKDKVWVATNKGISVFDAHSYKFISAFTSSGLLISNDIKDMDLHENKVYVATSAGVSIISLEKFISRSPPPRVYIKDLVVNGKNYADSASPRFSYFNGTIRCSYRAVTFQARESVIYRYKITNTDEQWNETSADELEFYDLNPGCYELTLSAKKYNSDWSPPVRLRFTITPLWYQTAAFKVLMVCLIALLIFWGTYLVLRSHKRKSDTQRRMLESELKAIRLYMNPHFIFNSLSSLQLFILKNRSRDAGNYISRFSKLIRSIMMYSERQEITLGDEIDFLKNYIGLEQSRFDNGFALQLWVDPQLDIHTTYIPPLVIQPIVENAIKYGLAGKEEPGVLGLSFEKKNDLIFVSVEDNGAGRDKVQQQQALSPNKTPSTGIKYTLERLKLLLKGRNVASPVLIHDLFDKGKAAGTKVQLIIPILK